MGIDRHLIDTIKTHFANTSSAQLQEIVQAKDLARWSMDAITAAREVLHDRASGRAVEPPAVEEEPPASSSSGWDDDIRILCLGLNLMGAPFGLDIFPVFESASCADDSDDALAGDLPVPFGPKTAWLALRTSDTARVARALGLQEVRRATWAEGIYVMQLACLWSIDPTSLNREFKEPVMGLLGDADWRV